MKIINIVSLFFVGIFLLVSCNNASVYNKYNDIEDHTWDKDSVCFFSYNAEDTINHYDVLLNIRHNSEFRFQNLWLFTVSTDPNGNIAKDTLECYLYNQLGEPLGQDYFFVYEMPLFYMQNIKFPIKGEYKFEIYQAMRDTILKGVESIGLTIQQNNYGKE
jgi:gliding motility-associated lipoprotein GldH